MAPPRKPAPAPRPVNPIRTQRIIKPPNATPPIRKPTGSVTRPAKQTCPNQECNAPHINDEGTCTNCGTIVNDSNIVSEVSFGEDSRGAAVLQGSYVGEGQGAARTMGPAFRGAGASPGDSRLATHREGEYIYMYIYILIYIPRIAIDSKS